MCLIDNQVYVATEKRIMNLELGVVYAGLYAELDAEIYLMHAVGLNSPIDRKLYWSLLR